MLHTIVGGKLTTHRSLAERCIANIFGFAAPSPTRTQPLPGGEGPREVTEPLWWRHGSRFALVRQLARDEPAWAAPLCPHRPFLAAELVHALRHEGAVTFADVMMRRLVHALGPCREPECLRAAQALFGRERRWPVDGDAERALAALAAEVDVLCGDLAPWRAHAAGAGA
jgi:glycerol-3-phosphate dehydrogenase